jgi:hypothetical protein
VLERIGSLPLKLDIGWPPEAGTLELIPSSSPIRQLSLWNRDFDSGLDRLEHLNLSKLSELRLGFWGTVLEKYVLDLGLKSTCEELSVSYSTSLFPPSESFFTHEVMERVVKLHVLGM